MSLRLLLILLILPLIAKAQETNSKADNLFYGYQYKSAIDEYIKEQQKKPLTNNQILNLADSYYKTGQYKKASELYEQINRNDTIMSINRFNNMLQSLAKDSEVERIKAILRTKSASVTNELLENAEFNYDLYDNPNVDTNIEIGNLSINTSQADISPGFYNGNLLFSSSRPQKGRDVYGPTGESYMDIYSAKINGDGSVTNPVLFNKIPKSEFHKSTPYFSEASNSLFYILSNTEGGEMAFDAKGKNSLAIGMISESGQFRFLLRDSSTSFYYPFFDDKSGKLYFAANFDDSYGGTDLYYVFTNKGQIMSAPVNLGPRINSPGNEIAPFILNGSLYFSSDVFYGLGGMDIYKSNIRENNDYSIPVNLGLGINSNNDDFGFIVKRYENGEYGGYFASNRIEGKGGDDLYHFKMQGSPGLKTFTYQGMVVNTASSDAVFKAHVELLDESGELLREAYTQNNGRFLVEIPWVNSVTVKVSKDNFSHFLSSYSEQEMETVEKEFNEINLVQLDDLVEETEGKKVIKLKKFYFAKNSTKLNPEITTELDKVVEAVQNFPEVKLRIETHTDSRGSNASNQRLSQQRSDVIRDYLVKKGVSAETILESVGYGEENIKNNCTNGVYCLDFLHKQNERTLIEVVSN